MPSARASVLAAVACLVSGGIGYSLGSRSPAPPDRAPIPAAPPTPAPEIAVLVRERDALRKEVAALKAPAPEASKPKPSPAPPPPDPATTLQGKAWRLMRPLVDDVLQVGDAVKRAAALDAIRQALESKDPVRILTGLMAVNSIGSIEYDKASLRPLVVPHLESPEEPLRRLGMWALVNTGPNPADLELLLRMENDSSADVRSQLPGLLGRAANGELTGEVSRVILKSMEGASARDMRGVLPGWFKTLSPELEERLLALARDPEMRHDVVYYTLSGATKKTAGMVDALIDAARCDDGETSRRALWGLCYGVPPDLAPRVAPVLLKVVEEKGTAADWETALRGLREIGTASELPGLEGLAENALAPERMRKAAREAADSVRRRLPK